MIGNVRLASRFVYVAAALDVFSRRGVGWAAGPNIKTELPRRGLLGGIGGCFRHPRPFRPLRVWASVRWRRDGPVVFGTAELPAPLPA